MGDSRGGRAFWVMAIMTVLSIASIFTVAIISVFIKIRSVEEKSSEPSYVEEVWNDVPEDLRETAPQLSDDVADDENYIKEESDYIKRLADAGHLRAAENRLEAFTFELDINRDKLNNCQLADIYETAVYVKERPGWTDDDDGDTRQSSREEAAKYRSMCDEQ